MNIGIAMALKNVSGALDDAIHSLRAFGVSEVAVSDASGDPSVRERFAPVADLVSAYFVGPDGGQSHGLHRAFEALSTPVVGWLNHDDFLVQGGAGIVSAALGDLDAVYGEALFLDQSGDAVGYHPNVAASPEILPRENCIAQPSCFFRRGAYEAVGGLRLDLHYTMDWDLWIRMRLAGVRFGYVGRLLSGVTLDPDAKTARFSLARMREIAGILARHGASPGQIAGHVTESMKTSLLWRRRDRPVPHPYFTSWADGGGAHRAPAVASDDFATIFSRQPKGGGKAQYSVRSSPHRIVETPGAHGRLAAFEPVRVLLETRLRDVERIRLVDAT